MFGLHYVVFLQAAAGLPEKLQLVAELVIRAQFQHFLILPVPLACDHRHLINSPMLPNMKKNGAGSLTLYIQKDSPDADKQANWLPAPNDTVYLVMRLYWPKTETPSVLPPGEGTWAPPGIVKAM